MVLDGQLGYLIRVSVIPLYLAALLKPMRMLMDTSDYAKRTSLISFKNTKAEMEGFSPAESPHNQCQ